MSLLDSIKQKFQRRTKRAPMHREVVATMRRAQAMHNGKIKTQFVSDDAGIDLAQVAREAGL